MIRLIIILTLAMGVNQAKDFETEYLSCTIVKLKKDTNGIEVISERKAKTRNDFEKPMVVRETEFVVSKYSILPYTETSADGYDIYQGAYLTAYYKKYEMLILSHNKIGTIEYYECEKRDPTLEERAKVLKDKWFK